MTLSFGTDGIRGRANVDLTPELAMTVGRATAKVLGMGGVSRFLIGRDTRESGPELQAGLSEGIASEGMDVIDLGVLPTPGVAFCSALEKIPAAVVSASHNPYTDNGIKLFGATGSKLPDDVEREIQDLLGSQLSMSENPERGSISFDSNLLAAYERHLMESVEGRTFEELRVVLDCANGSASEIAPDVMRQLGAEVIVINDSPDGENINANCGSTHPESLQRAVLDAEADAGFAFDGDADRVLAVDSSGALIDGDQLMGICALDLRQRGRLRGDTVVITVMTNLGFRLAMERHGITTIETKVGDRYVLEALEAGGWALGGEQSGHIIFPDLATTGDGTLTALQILDVIRRTGRKLSDLAAESMTRLPQELRNVSVQNIGALEDATELWSEVAEAEAELGRQGRVLLRASGTEPLIRVMVEATTQEKAQEVTDRLCSAVERTLGAAV